MKNNVKNNVKINAKTDMNKQYKPVPDVECLKYHGTPEKPDIKIFVSHRIDQDSETIDNPLFIPVRCGAVYDEREGVTMLGDDTGDNISKKRLSYCELTVQYWAWKNVKADYYGLCHYRRYHNFSGVSYPVATGEANNGCVVAESFSQENIDKFGLTEAQIRLFLKDADVVVHRPIQLKDSGAKNNYDAMRSSPKYHNMHDIDTVLEIISKKYPEMMRYANEYMSSTDSWLYNCYIMKAEIFDAYCSWIFDILSELEKVLDDKNYTMTQFRAPGLIAEHFFGAYLLYLREKGKYRIVETELVFLNNSKKSLIPSSTKTKSAKEEVVLVSNFNNNYVPIFTVFLASLLQHMSEEYIYNYIILTDDITDANKKLIEEMITNKNNIYVQYCSPRKHLEGIDLFVNNPVYTTDMYYRVIVPFILLNHTKALVLDVDMICLEDPAALFFEDIKDYYAGAVKDVVYQGWLNGFVPDTKDYASNILHLDDPYNYCNTGVILMNLDLIRQNFSEEYVRGFINSHEFRIYEQDTINVLFQNKIKFLDPKWNLFTYTNAGVEESVILSSHGDAQAYYSARKAPGLVHYAAHPKPWTNPHGDLSELFWKYARLSPYYERLLLAMFQVNNPNPSVSTPPDTRSGARKIADVFLPIGSRRREFAKKLLPKGSLRWRFCKQIYYIFAPQYRPKKN